MNIRLKGLLALLIFNGMGCPRGELIARFARIAYKPLFE